jgi:hypothetical protein
LSQKHYVTLPASRGRRDGVTEERDTYPGGAGLAAGPEAWIVPIPGVDTSIRKLYRLDENRVDVRRSARDRKRCTELQA